MAILYLKAVHIIFVVSWFAGLFYIIRLFIYHVEAEEKPEPERSILQKQYTLMEGRLWNIITVPAMVLTVATGIAMIWMNPSYYLHAPWMQVKFGFVILLLIYHFMCGRMVRQLKNGIMPASGLRLRMWNEVATLLLIAIVFIVEVQNWLDWIWGTIGLIALAVLFAVIVKSVHKMWKK